MSHIYMGIIVPATIVLPLIAGILYYRHLSVAMRFIFYYLVVSGCINVVAVILSYHDMNNLPLLHLLTVAELFFLLRYYTAIIHFKNSRFIINIVCALAILFCIIDAAWIESIFTFNSYSRGLTAIIMIVFSILYFIMPATQLKQLIHVYAVAGIISYYAGSFLIFLFANFLKAGYSLSSVLWVINATLVLIMYLLFTKAFLLCRPTTISTSSS